MTGLTITNPLVLYRSLIATQRIQSDPAQHRLALHLQKLYERLIDYEPSVEYSHRLKQLSRAVDTDHDSPKLSLEKSTIGTRGIWTSLLAQKERRDSLALTRVLTSHEAALNLQSPKGLMLHGEVGTGKSMLIDLFADCLPNRKKHRWHFNTFMLETISSLEQLRRSRGGFQNFPAQDEYSLLWLARDLIDKSPILFLDEFQLPDRAASKILSNLMTSFFQLGGVLIATSNRMPEELAKAAGMEFARPVSRLSRLGWRLGMSGVVGRDDGPGQKGEFAQFLEVLRARCEVWEMEGKQDYRRLSGEDDQSTLTKQTSDIAPSWSTPAMPSGHPNAESLQNIASTPASVNEVTMPKHYLITPPATSTDSEVSAYTDSIKEILHNLTGTAPSEIIYWTATTLTVYGRPISIPLQYQGIAVFDFSQLCGASLGPADYITLASTYHTLVIFDVPVLNFLQKNEARRFITLLDAFYEARCRLLITASAGPDSIFFPTAPVAAGVNNEDTLVGDAVHPETYSEIHQDLTSPFRPNISSYSPSSPSLPIDALEDDPPNRIRHPGSSYTDERKLAAEGAKAPDFSNVGGLTGEDEQFAVKRAESRIWEMCSKRWWNRASSVEDTSWWRPLPLESRHWERGASTSALGSPAKTEVRADLGEHDAKIDENVDPKADQHEDIFAHGASPFRNTSDTPPKIEWTHIWGMVKWGKRAGAWGKGIEGLEERWRGKEERKEHGAVTNKKEQNISG